MLKYKTTACALLLMIVLLSLLTACGGVRYQDGFYYAELPEFGDSGWKEIAEVTIEGGKIAKINWDAVYIDDSIPIRKKQYSKSGLYGMLKGGASGEWYDQATVAQQFVMEYGIDALNLSADGYSDAVSGCTINMNSFDTLFRQCLEQAKR